MNCIKPKCGGSFPYFIIDSGHAVVPGECDIGNMRQLLSFFEHKAPNIDSVHSPILDESMHKQALDRMLGGNTNYVFCAHSANTQDELARLSLAGNVLCSRCKRFLCKRSGRDSKRVPGKKETDLECLLRHLRNAIAHGHVYVFHGGNYISVLFEDINNSGKTTARIICCQADLKKWKAILENALSHQQ